MSCYYVQPDHNARNKTTLNTRTILLNMLHASEKPMVWSWMIFMSVCVKYRSKLVQCWFLRRPLTVASGEHKAPALSRFCKAVAKPSFCAWVQGPDCTTPVISVADATSSFSIMPIRLIRLSHWPCCRACTSVTWDCTSMKDWIRVSSNWKPAIQEPDGLAVLPVSIASEILTLQVNANKSSYLQSWSLTLQVNNSWRCVDMNVV